MMQSEQIRQTKASLMQVKDKEAEERYGGVGGSWEVGL